MSKSKTIESSDIFYYVNEIKNYTGIVREPNNGNYICLSNGKYHNLNGPATYFKEYRWHVDTKEWLIGYHYFIHGKHYRNNNDYEIAINQYNLLNNLRKIKNI